MKHIFIVALLAARIKRHIYFGSSGVIEMSISWQLLELTVLLLMAVCCQSLSCMIPVRSYFNITWSSHAGVIFRIKYYCKYYNELIE